MLRALAVVGTAVVIMRSTSQDIRYIVSPKFGNFLVAVGKDLGPSDAYAVLPGKNLCHCRSLCVTDVNCRAVSLVESDGGSTCRLANKGPADSTVIDNAQATYIFWQDSLPNGTYELRPEDNQLYLHNPNMLLKLDDAKNFCAKIPGHRLAIFKKLTQWPIIEYYGHMDDKGLVLDLRKKDGGVFWGDGTNHEDTELRDREVISSPGETVFIMITKWTRNFLQDISDREFRFLCQAKPFGP